MSALKWGLVVVGALLFLMGTVFFLQGEDVIKGSSVMSGVSEWIYIGAAIAVIGVVLMAAGALTGRSKGTTAQPAAGASA